MLFQYKHSYLHCTSIKCLVDWTIILQISTMCSLKKKTCQIPHCVDHVYPISDKISFIPLPISMNFPLIDSPTHCQGTVLVTGLTTGVAAGAAAISLAGRKWWNSSQKSWLWAAKNEFIKNNGISRARMDQVKIFGCKKLFRTTKW